MYRTYVVWPHYNFTHKTKIFKKKEDSRCLYINQYVCFERYVRHSISRKVIGLKCGKREKYTSVVFLNTEDNQAGLDVNWNISPVQLINSRLDDVACSFLKVVHFVTSQKYSQLREILQSLFIAWRPTVRWYSLVSCPQRGRSICVQRVFYELPIDWYISRPLQVHARIKSCWHLSIHYMKEWISGLCL